MLDLIHEMLLRVEAMLIVGRRDGWADPADEHVWEGLRSQLRWWHDLQVTTEQSNASKERWEPLQ